MVEDHRLIDVDRCAVLLLAVSLQAVDVPAHRYGDLIPRGDVEAGEVEVLGTLLGGAYPVESPLAIQTLVQGAVLGKYPCDLIALGEGEEVGMGTLLVQSIPLRALPFIPLRCLLTCVAVAWH